MNVNYDLDAVLRDHEVVEKLTLKRNLTEGDRRSLIRQLTTDDLTGLSNKKEFIYHLTNAAEIARELPVYVGALDIDGFRNYNTEYGHDAGDELIKTVGSYLRENFRNEDCFLHVKEENKEALVEPKSPWGRFGGDEFFGLFFRVYDVRGLVYHLNDARRGLNNIPELRKNYLTMSIGLAHLEPGRTGREILKRADEALYKVKEMGKNRVLLWNNTI